MKRIITLFFILTLTVCMLAVGASAEPLSNTEMTADGEETGRNEVRETETDTDTNPFESLYSLIYDNADKLLALLAFLGSIILTVAYKRGMLPLIKGGLGALGSAVKALKDEADRASCASSNGVQKAAEKLQRAEEILNLLTERIENLNNELSAAKDERSKYTDITTVLISQIELLYDVFMSSSLPAYQKEAVGERVREMKKLLKAGSENE